MNKQKVVILILVIFVIWKCFDYYILDKSYPVSGYNVADESGATPFVEIFKVSIYYEALCSDSRNFILKQLVPAYENLHKYMIIDFVPYGKAETFDKEGKTGFKCQHGVTECVANKIHACALDMISQQKVQLKYVACMINDNMIPHEAGQRCGEDLGIDYNPILECANGVKGSTLLKTYGERTHAVSPTISFIPTIEVNESQQIPLPQVLKDFNKELCKLFLVTPKECL